MTVKHSQRLFTTCRDLYSLEMIIIFTKKHQLGLQNVKFFKCDLYHQNNRKRHIELKFRKIGLITNMFVYIHANYFICPDQVLQQPHLIFYLTFFQSAVVFVLNLHGIVNDAVMFQLFASLCGNHIMQNTFTMLKNGN